MRLFMLATLPVLAMLALPARGDAQISATVHFGPPQRSWGHEVVVTDYAPEVYGGWQTAYRRWTPVTLYYVNGHYYPRRVRGARAVVVYRYRGHTFLPPRDDGWNKKDRRYNYTRRPVDEDYQHVKPAPPPPRSRPRP